ncbi:hypothetical protein LTS10_004335 [Elasticomyces elasticus]|nr:hypothetical protein LTS10_004335 [Elasticomyces elasticus]
MATQSQHIDAASAVVLQYAVNFEAAEAKARESMQCPSPIYTRLFDVTRVLTVLVDKPAHAVHDNYYDILCDHIIHAQTIFNSIADASEVLWAAQNPHARGILAAMNTALLRIASHAAGSLPGTEVFECKYFANTLLQEAGLPLFALLQEDGRSVRVCHTCGSSN